MSIAKRTRRVGVLAVVLGIGAAAVTYPGIAIADPSAEPAPGASQVEGPGPGGSDPKTELGVVSSGGSTPPLGAGSVGAGSGSDESSGPGQAVDSTGTTGSSIELAPGVVVQSSGGALTSTEHEQTTAGTQQAAQDQASTEDSSAATTPGAEQVVVPTTEVSTAPAAVPAAPVEEVAVVAGVTTPSGGASAGPRNGPVVPRISEVQSIALLSTGAGLAFVSGREGGEQGSVIGYGTLDRTVPVAAMAVRPPSTEPGQDPSARESLRLFTGVLAAALAPFVVPLPGSPVDAPTLWAVLAWVRRQSDTTSSSQPQLIALPRLTELVVADADADPPGAIVDRIDRATGRVSGHVNIADLADDERNGLTYSLLKQVDRRLGVVTVKDDTGQWTFTPKPAARLSAELHQDGVVAAFSVAASNGRTVDVRAPVDSAEAVVTGTIDVGSGLTYGLAVIGDRLYVLNGAEHAAGNGSVKVVDTSTKMVIGSVEVGSMPYALAASGGSLYVGNADDGTVSVVDVSSNTVVDVIDVGANPFGLEVTRDRLYVADHAGTVSVIDLRDNTELVRIPIGGDPFGLAATADRVYVTNYSGGTVAVLDQATNTADSVDTAGYPYFAAVIGGRLYVVNVATNALTIVDRSITTAVDVDPATRALDAIPADASPVDMVVRGDRLYVSNINRGTVTVIDVATNQPVENIGVGIQPGLLAASRSGDSIYVADVMGGTVRVITSVRHAAR